MILMIVVLVLIIGFLTRRAFSRTSDYSSAPVANSTSSLPAADDLIQPARIDGGPLRSSEPKEALAPTPSASEKRYSILEDKTNTLQTLYSDHFEHSAFDVVADWADLQRLEFKVKHIFYTTIAGTSHKNGDRTSRVSGIRKCKEGDILGLVHENENAFDQNAIAVMSDERQLGYIPSPLAKEMVRNAERNDSSFIAVFRRPTLHPETSKVVGAVIAIFQTR